MGKPRKPLVERLRFEAEQDIKRDAKRMPANRVTMRDLLLEAEARILQLEAEADEVAAVVLKENPDDV